MNSHASSAPAAPAGGISPAWSKLPLGLIALGALGSLIGAFVPGLQKQFAFSWLLAFMFFLSLCLGSLFLVLIHHLFDSNWSVPLRRVVEHIACLAPVMGVLFLPILVNVWIASPEKLIYGWMDPAKADHALHAKEALFNKPAFTIVAIGLFLIWTAVSWGLLRWSLEQDKTGAALCTVKMRRYAASGIFLFAPTLTLGAIYWMKSLQHQFFSTMYGVYYFAGSVWMTLATVYVITLLLKKAGPLREVAQRRQFHDLAVLMLAFTVFYAYIHFSQYFLIWNAAVPEETFWYVVREKGSWWGIGMLIIFGHFLVPFLTLLRIDAKLSLPLMMPLCVWAWMMHFCDVSFNVMPVLHPDGFVLHWLDLTSLALIGGVLAKVFLKSFYSHPPYPQRDPRIAETMGVYVPEAGATGSRGGAQ